MQARLGSERFKRKILADLNGQPIVVHVVTRAQQIRGVDRVVLAVPASDYGEIEHAVIETGVKVYGHPGDENDVLGRFVAVARRYRASTALRITADCPVLDPRVAEQVLELYRTSHCDYAWTDTASGEWPDGFDVECFSRAALETAHGQATELVDREHVTSWIRRNLRCVTLHNPEPWTGPRKLSVDSPEDLEVVRQWMRSERGIAGTTESA